MKNAQLSVNAPDQAKKIERRPSYAVKKSLAAEPARTAAPASAQMTAPASSAPAKKLPPANPSLDASQAQAVIKASPAPAAASQITGSLNIVNTDEKFSIVIDPGHGGRYEPARANSGDHWDPFTRTFLLPYNFGANAAGMFEHEWTLAVAKKVRALLMLTQTDAGFVEFSKLIRKYSKDPSAPIRKVKINTFLTREYSWETDPEKNMPNVNRKYRLFDSPESFTGGKPSDKTYLGRISYINQISPDLVVCLHTNSNPNRSARGYSSVIAPHFDFFSNVNNVMANTNQAKVSTEAYGKISGLIAATFNKLANVDIKTMVSDTATYFTGFRAFTNKFIGLRYLMVTWRYNTNSILSSFLFFFMRENSVYELYKRSGGPENYGGDNFYSSEELIRFIRYSLLNDIKTTQPGFKCVNADEAVGKHGEPFVSDWAIPLFVNAITAFVEVGYISNAKDRKILKERQDAIAEGIAVGVYSLFSGVKIDKSPEIETPKGLPIDFEKYGRNKNSNGYFNISCEPISF